MFILILWSAIVTSLTTQTHTYQKCKNKECVVKIEKVGYSIQVKEEK